MGHYLTYESLRHNQLPFTFKDHWVMATLSFLPLRPHASAKVSWRRGLRSPWLCDHPKSCGGPALQVVGKRGLSAALVQAPVPCHASWPCARLSKRVVQPAGKSRYLDRQTVGGPSDSYSLHSEALWATKGVSQTSAYIRVRKKGSMLSQTKSSIQAFTFVKCFWERITVWRNSEVKVLDSIVPWRGDVEGHFQKDFVKNLNKQVCGLRGEPACRLNCPARHRHYSGLGVLARVHKNQCLF